MHQEFEKWFSTLKRREEAVWHPDLNRYTVLSTKQLLWESWHAARGIPYVYNNGYIK